MWETVHQDKKKSFRWWRTTSAYKELKRKDISAWSENINRYKSQETEHEEVKEMSNRKRFTFSRLGVNWDRKLTFSSHLADYVWTETANLIQFPTVCLFISYTTSYNTCNWWENYKLPFDSFSYSWRENLNTKIVTWDSS